MGGRLFHANCVSFGQLFGGISERGHEHDTKHGGLLAEELVTGRFDCGLEIFRRGVEIGSLEAVSRVGEIFLAGARGRPTGTRYKRQENGDYEREEEAVPHRRYSCT